MVGAAGYYINVCYGRIDEDRIQWNLCITVLWEIFKDNKISVNFTASSKINAPNVIPCGWNYWCGMKFGGWRNYFANNNIKRLKILGTCTLMWKYVFRLACIYNNM